MWINFGILLTKLSKLLGRHESTVHRDGGRSFRCGGRRPTEAPAKIRRWGAAATDRVAAAANVVALPPILLSATITPFPLFARFSQILSLVWVQKYFWRCFYHSISKEQLIHYSWFNYKQYVKLRQKRKMWAHLVTHRWQAIFMKVVSGWILYHLHSPGS